MDTTDTYTLTMTPIKSGVGRIVPRKKGGHFIYVPASIARDSVFSKLIDGRLTITMFSNGSLHVDPI